MLWNIIYISNEKIKKNQKNKIDMMVWMGDVGWDGMGCYNITLVCVQRTENIKRDHVVEQH